MPLAIQFVVFQCEEGIFDQMRKKHRSAVYAMQYRTSCLVESSRSEGLGGSQESSFFGC